MHDTGGEDRVHEAHLGVWPGDHLVIMAPAAHGDVGAAVGLANDDSDARHRNQTG